MKTVQHTGNASHTNRALQDTKDAPPREQRLALMQGPYKPPNANVGDEITCLLRGRARVGFGTETIPGSIVDATGVDDGALALRALMRKFRRHQVFDESEKNAKKMVDASRVVRYKFGALFKQINDEGSDIES